jgi:hypothetical protein
MLLSSRGLVAAQELFPAGQDFAASAGDKEFSAVVKISGTGTELENHCDSAQLDSLTTCAKMPGLKKRKLNEDASSQSAASSSKKSKVPAKRIPAKPSPPPAPESSGDDEEEVEDEEGVDAGDDAAETTAGGQTEEEPAAADAEPKKTFADLGNFSLRLAHEELNR